MIGVCTESGATLTLIPGQKYYLFPNGPNHFYVSKFNSKDAHFGCYRSNYFEIAEESVTEEHTTFEQLSLF